MINCRYVIAFGGSLFVYLSIGVLFIIISQSTYKEIIAKESQSKITLSLEQFQKPQPLMPQPQNNPCCLIKPKQEPLKTVQKNPKIFQKDKQISKPKQNSSPYKQYTPQQLPKSSIPDKIDSGAFEAMVKNRIMQNKFYPLIAKNEGIEGIVNASFVILSNGNVGEISVSGSNALKGAARQAISRAFPIDVSNCPVSLPTTMHISLRYSLISD